MSQEENYEILFVSSNENQGFQIQRFSLVQK